MIDLSTGEVTLLQDTLSLLFQIVVAILGTRSMVKEGEPDTAGVLLEVLDHEVSTGTAIACSILWAIPIASFSLLWLPQLTIVFS